MESIKAPAQAREKRLILQDPETNLIVLLRPEGYLVIDPNGGDESEVVMSDNCLKCTCFIAQVSPDGVCSHIQAVEAYLSKTHESIKLTQADADYYLARVAKIDAELNTNQLSADKQKQRIDGWLTHEQAKLEHRRSFYLTSLESWMNQERLTSKHLVNGSLQIRKQPVQIEVLDEAQILKNPKFQRIVPEKVEIDRRALRDHITQTGEEPDGVQINVVPPKFSYKLSGGV